MYCHCDTQHFETNWYAAATTTKKGHRPTYKRRQHGENLGQIQQIQVPTISEMQRKVDSNFIPTEECIALCIPVTKSCVTF